MAQKSFTVKLGQYTGLHYPSQKGNVSDAEVDQALEQERKTKGRLTAVGKAAELGDTVFIDYAGFCDGTQFPGGTSQEPYGLELGSHSFIPGFEEQLVGVVAGEDRTVHVTFPKVYQEPTLAGKKAEFRCHVHEVQQMEYPALSDQFATDFYGVKTLAELREVMRKSVEAYKEDQILNKAVEKLVAQIVASSEIDLTEDYLNETTQQMEVMFASQLRQQGATMEMYCDYQKITMDDLRKQLKVQATVNARNVAVLTTIADQEGLEVTDEEFEQELRKLATQYHTDLNQMKQMIPAEQQKEMRDGFKTTKAIDFIMKHAIADEK